MMEDKKANEPSAKDRVDKKQSLDQLRAEHPFETDSQIENRYGSGREKSGSDGSADEAQANNH